ncbi:hypothetical protein MTR_0338s0050 [Medicago truncatula]|uniref:Uncharacterized protein n=1 Tax=Medicago truncatula TaxID=3880 RepID=A0A072TEU2_MEDTR|nr:hypothetical protein MTR_0338s0050 [Medicago truncatula]
MKAGKHDFKLGSGFLSGNVGQAVVQDGGSADNGKKKNKKINDKKVKNTVSLLTQFGATSTTLGATKPGRKSTSVVLIQKLSTNSSFTLYDLGPTRLDFNLGTPRSEISSHCPMVSHSPCELSDLNKHKN